MVPGSGVDGDCAPAPSPRQGALSARGGTSRNSSAAFRPAEVSAVHKHGFHGTHEAYNAMINVFLWEVWRRLSSKQEGAAFPKPKFLCLDQKTKSTVSCGKCFPYALPCHEKFIAKAPSNAEKPNAIVFCTQLTGVGRCGVAGARAR